MPRLKIGGKWYQQSYLYNEEHYAAVQAVLRRHHSTEAFCDCQDPHLKVTISERRSETGSVFHLGAFRSTGKLHDDFCRLGKFASAGEGVDGAVSGIQESELRVSISTSASLAGVAPRGPSSVSGNDAPGSGGVARATATLRGVLDYLWDEASLNVWNEDEANAETARSADTVRRRLSKFALNERRKVRINKQQLKDVLFQPMPIMEPAKLQSLLHGLKRQNQKSALLSVFEIESWNVTPQGGSIRPAGMDGRITYLLESPVAGEVLTSWDRAIGSFANGKGRLIAIATIDVANAAAGELLIREMALMLTNHAYIPADSNFELQVANDLVAANRSFVKPLRRLPRQRFLPDFVMFDTRPYWYLEVYGMKTEDYLKHKANKEAYYLETKRKVWRWNAADGGGIPAFPIASEAV